MRTAVAFRIKSEGRFNFRGIHSRSVGTSVEKYWPAVRCPFACFPHFGVQRELKSITFVDIISNIEMLESALFRRKRFGSLILHFNALPIAFNPIRRFPKSFSPKALIGQFSTQTPYTTSRTVKP